jgi:hypothetical protein
MTWVDAVMIQGQMVYEKSKDKRLRELLQGVYDSEKAKSVAAEAKKNEKDATAKPAAKPESSKSEKKN